MSTIQFRVARALAAVVFLVAPVVASAEAAVIGTATLVKDPANGIPFAAPDAALGSPWVSYILGLESTAGQALGAVDFSATGQFHQRWNDSDSDGVFEPSVNSSNLTNGDSHLIVLGGYIFFDNWREDNSGVGSPLVDTETRDYGLGTFLVGAWGLPGLTTASTNIAYIVIPKDEERNLQIRVRVASTQGQIIEELDTSDFFVPEPESTVLCCLALGGLICSVRRRRQVM